MKNYYKLNKLSPAPFAREGTAFISCTCTAKAKGEFVGYGRTMLLGWLGALEIAEPPSKSGI